MNITILGSGRWASCLAWYAHTIGHSVCMWGRPGSKSLTALKNTHQNEYLTLDSSIRFSESLHDALSFSDHIIISISSQYLRDLCRDIARHSTQNKTFVLAMKGVEKGTGLRLSQIVDDEITNTHTTVVWVGPGHVQSFVNMIPNCMLMCSQSEDMTKQCIDIFTSDLIRLYIGDDLIGIEIGAAAKNVVGIAAGMLDGFGYTSLKGALMARGSREVSRLVMAMGGNERTVYGLSHIGDYEATLFSPYSHNRAFGEAYVLKKPFLKLAEGVSTAESLMFLAKKYGVDMPITAAVFAIVNQSEEPQKVLKNLFLRETKHEF